MTSQRGVLNGSSEPPSPSDTQLHKLDNKKSVRPFKTNDEYLYAMREDLAAWFNDLYATNLTADTLLERLQDGVALCQHANNVKSYIEAAGADTTVPNITYRTNVKPESFQARDNVANFISWVRSYLGINDVLIFESDDLVMNKNEKSVILCVLEVARKGARYGMLAPMLVQFEQEIEALEQRIKQAQQVERRNSEGNATVSCGSISDTDSDKASLDEWVQHALQQCTCPKQFPMTNLSRGKYRVGKTQNIVFVRILRSHVMIRVGGGWDTLEHYLDKHDPCRCHAKLSHNATTRKTRQHSGTGKDLRLHAGIDKSPVTKTNRSQSIEDQTNSVHSKAERKYSGTKSSDVLCADLVIKRDDSGHHLVDESCSFSNPSSPARKTQHKNSITASHKIEHLKAQKQTTRPASPSAKNVHHRENAHRSTTPDIMHQNSTRARSTSRPGRSRINDKPRSGSRSNQRSVTRSQSRNNSRPSTPVYKSNSRPSTPTLVSDSRPSTPTLSVEYTGETILYKKSKCTMNNNIPFQENLENGSHNIFASPRKERRPSDRATRIPAPVYSQNIHAMNTGDDTLSSTNSCCSTESLKTV